MKITGIKQYCCTFGSRNLLFVKVETDEGIYGMGEATLRGKTTQVMESVKLLGERLIGMSAYDIEYWFHKYFYYDRWRNGPIMNTAISGIEIALWDAMGKRLEVPVYKLLGGKVRDRCELYANTSADYVPELIAKGFKAYKMMPISYRPFNSPDRDVVTKEDMLLGVEKVAALREKVGPDFEIFIECHGRLNYDQSLQMVRMLEPYKPGFIEEPMPPDDWEGFKKLALKSNIPIATGERLFTRWGHKRLYEEGIASIAQPDFTHCGGIFESKKMAAMAEMFYIKVAPHNSSGPVATIASIHVDATLPNFFMQEFMYSNIEVTSRLFEKFPKIENGAIVLDDTPGLGFVPNFEELERGEFKSNNNDW